MTDSLTDRRTDSLTASLITHSLTHSLTNTHSFTHPHTHSSTHPTTHSLTHSRNDWLANSQTLSLTVWLSHWLTPSVTHWLTELRSEVGTSRNVLIPPLLDAMTQPRRADDYKVTLQCKRSGYKRCKWTQNLWLIDGICSKEKKQLWCESLTTTS
jgi:hypothetical protein